MTLFFELLAVAALIALNAFFVAGEYGLVTARRTRIRELEEQGDRRARSVLQITADPPRFIAAMQLGVTATSLGIGAVGEQVFAQIFDPFLATAVASGIKASPLKVQYIPTTPTSERTAWVSMRLVPSRSSRPLAQAAAITGSSANRLR